MKYVGHCTPVIQAQAEFMFDLCLVLNGGWVLVLTTGLRFDVAAPAAGEQRMSSQ
jgi:hypothetical protein